MCSIGGDFSSISEWFRNMWVVNTWSKQLADSKEIHPKIEFISWLMDPDAQHAENGIYFGSQIWLE